MRLLLYLFVVFATSLNDSLAQESTPSAPAEEAFIEIIQTPAPVEPVESVEPEPTDPTKVTEEIPAPELPQLLPDTTEPPVETQNDPATQLDTSEPEAAEPEKPAGPKRIKFPAADNVLLDPPLPPHPHGKTPDRSGDTTGDVYIAHRSVVEKYNGWGWVKHESESWRDAQWVAVREKLGQVILPGRHLQHPDNDDGMQYRFYGEFSTETAYEPNKDVFVAVFNLKGFEVIGRASKPSGTTLPRSKTSATRSKPTTGGARSNPFRR
ncbi:MAG: hypothetical protein AAF649_06205 [Verrucomicrobiota bacterium]